jgi:hypothetical protein
VTPRQLNALTAYVRRLRNWLGLQHWEISIVDQAPSDNTARAQLETSEGRYHAGLWVGDNFLESPAEEQRQTIVHELLHVAAREQNDVIRAGGLTTVLGQDAYRVVWENYLAAHERATDHLASVIAQYAPLPRIPKR